MTHQEIFDFVWTKLCEQGAKSYENGKCRYRTSTRLKCAVGHLIPDDLYDPAMEGAAQHGPAKPSRTPAEVRYDLVCGVWS